jgi:7,8-dihydro-6-hydroxymethylpterin dimethyltransferase
VLREDGILIAATKYEGSRKAAENASASARDYVRRHWKYKEPVAAPVSHGCETESACRTGPGNLFDRIQSHTLCISGMAFQDAWNIDLERLQRCCVHVATAQGKLIPFCSYYLTDSSGRKPMWVGASAPTPREK